MYAMISTYNVCNDIYRKLIQRKLSIFLFLAFIGWERFDFHGFSIYFQSPLVFFLMLFALFIWNKVWRTTTIRRVQSSITSSFIFYLIAIHYVFKIFFSITTHNMFVHQLKVFILHSFIFMKIKMQYFSVVFTTRLFVWRHAYMIVLKMNKKWEYFSNIYS